MKSNFRWQSALITCYFVSVIVATVSIMFVGIANIKWLIDPLFWYCLCGYSSFILLAVVNRWLGVWACKDLGWHLAPSHQGFDGCSLNGRCPRCNKRVLQDSQGGWFEVHTQEDDHE